MASSALDPYPGYYPSEFHSKTNTLWYRPSRICPSCQEIMDLDGKGKYRCGSCGQVGRHEPVLCPNCMGHMAFNQKGYHQCEDCGLIDISESRPDPPESRIDRRRLRSLKRFGSLKREMRSGTW
jgi:tRNA(Ile2) C34 agmatinyltransferase TiaS